MQNISVHDRQRIRALAVKKLEMANSARNAEILRQWEALAQGRRESPTVRLLFSNFYQDVVTDRLECYGDAARALEANLLSSMVGRELYDDDTPISPTFDIVRCGDVNPFGIAPKKTWAKEGQGFHIDPVIEDLEAEIDKLRNGGFYVDNDRTRHLFDFAEDVLGDILKVRLVMPNLTGSLTNNLVQLTGMENYYFALCDAPDAVHEIMDMGTRVYEAYYDYLEREKLLLPTCGISPISQESFAFNHELPADHAESTKQVWGFLESQETTAVSPEMFGEFVFPYQDRLVRRYGLLSYGCCERVEAIWLDYLSKWTNLRKLSVSPFNNERLVGEYLRGSNVIYYSKPRAEFVTNPGPLDEAALRKYFKEVFTCASGCLLEVAQREVGTLYGDNHRGREYVRIAKACVQEYWKP